MKSAIIDIGTNTFNLLIIESLENGSFSILYDDKLEAKIGRGGIHKSYITPEAFDRGMECLRKQKEIINHYKCEKIFAFGTSAMRNAENGNEFVQKAKEKFDITISVISGNEEAELIYEGNKHALEIKENVLILDIGGGSNEFIIANDKQILWKRSFELGMQRLLHLFTPSDPITYEEIVTIEKYLEENLGELKSAVEKIPAKILVGSSGSFDTFREMTELRLGISTKGASSELSMQNFTFLYNQITSLTQNELKNVKGMDMMRIEMLPVAVVFVNFIIRYLKIETIIQSRYSLKEGVVYKYLL